MINIAKFSTWVLFITVHFTRYSGAIKTALIVIDVQNCFLPGGSLAVPGGEAVVPVINSIRRDYGENIALTVFTQDWHCPDHVSFATEHDGKNAGEIITLQYDASGTLCQNSSCVVVYNVSQMLWPIHCVINTSSAEFSRTLTRNPTDIVMRKGFNCEVDSYSGFFDNGGFKQTELDSVLKSHQIQRVIMTGLAFDYCVSYSSQDAATLGYDTYVVEDASKPIADSSARQARANMKNKGVKVIQSRDLGTLFQTSSSSQIVPVMFITCITFLTSVF